MSVLFILLYNSEHLVYVNHKAEILLIWPLECMTSNLDWVCASVSFKIPGLTIWHCFWQSDMQDVTTFEIYKTDQIHRYLGNIEFKQLSPFNIPITMSQTSGFPSLRPAYILKVCYQMQKHLTWLIKR